MRQSSIYVSYCASVANLAGPGLGPGPLVAFVGGRRNTEKHCTGVDTIYQSIQTSFAKCPAYLPSLYTIPSVVNYLQPHMRPCVPRFIPDILPKLPYPHTNVSQRCDLQTTSQRVPDQVRSRSVPIERQPRGEVITRLHCKWILPINCPDIAAIVVGCRVDARNPHSYWCEKHERSCL